MKLGSLIYYILILFSCTAGAQLAGKIKFGKEIIFLAYVSIMVCGILEIVVARLPLFKYKIAILRTVYIAACATLSFFALRTTDEMIVQKELNISMDTIKDADVRIQSPYLVTITCEMSPDQFMGMVNALEFEKMDYWQFRPFNADGRQTWDLTELSQTALYFHKENLSEHDKPYSLKDLVYEAETMNAFYQHKNYRTVD